jgi:hypothetical protein
MTYYISVTGLQVKNIWNMPTFMSYAYSSMAQAQATEGNIKAMVTYRKGVHHTLTVWDDRKSMMKFLVAGAHRQAMKEADTISVPGGTKVYGYESETIPTSWDEVLKIWEEHGTRHGKKVATIAKETRISKLAISPLTLGGAALCMAVLLVLTVGNLQQ